MTFKPQGPRHTVSPSHIASSPTTLQHSSLDPSTQSGNRSAKGHLNPSSNVTSNPLLSLDPINASSGSTIAWDSSDRPDAPSFQVQDDWMPIYGSGDGFSQHDTSFDDFLTTAGSSENPLSEHTTPQELIWEREFMAQGNSQPQVLDPYSDRIYDYAHAPAAGSDLHAAFDMEDQFQKQYSNTNLMGYEPNDPPSGVITPQSMPPTDSCASHQHKRHSQALTVNTSPNNHLSPRQQVRPSQQSQSEHRISVSGPTVTISSYEPFEGNDYLSHKPYSATKRHRDSDSPDDDDSEELLDSQYHSGDLSPAHLMPPDPSDVGTLRSIPITSERLGQDPSQRTDEIVSSFKELELERELQEKKADVVTWLSKSEPRDDAADNISSTIGRQRSRSRAGSARGKVTPNLHQLSGFNTYPDIPGPGVLLEVDSDDEDLDSVSATSSALDAMTKLAVDEYREQDQAASYADDDLQAVNSPEQTSFPTLETDLPPELQEPLPRQFYRRAPWQDPASAGISNEKTQPTSSNAAAYKFNQEAVKWESASRAATWGTRRRLSETDINAVVDGSKVRHPSLSKRGRDRTSSFLSKARGLLPRRSSSNIKAEVPHGEDLKISPGHAHSGSVSTVKSLPRNGSYSNPMSPPLNSGSANFVKSGRPLQSLRKHRSKSDVSNKKSTTLGLAELMTIHGGPPVPTLASPMHERESILAAQVIDNEDAQIDDEDDEQADDTAIRMDLEVRAEEIEPTLEGFKGHARKLNPRLEPFLIERIGQEQLRRYKNLLDAKVKHIKAVQTTQKCTSGKYCFQLGGEAVQLSPRVSSKDPETTLTQFQVDASGANGIDDAESADGIVTPALFPSGIPLPPVKRLPAAFECQLCFRVKQGGFQKPSDWTKHVHEDVQPFSCTFPNCTESKSFKRKADWVRHENERHRHLEWWECRHDGCSHRCFRKDNFVQHLVREHKMKEPKSRASGSSKNKPVRNRAELEDAETWKMIDSCRFETTKQAREEPCRFCGNVCPTFKKLSVHMAKHMEQIAMPILELVRMAQVGADTIISPIEQSKGFPSGHMALTQTGNDMHNLSPYPTSASVYQNSSAGHSPTSMHGRSHSDNHGMAAGYYNVPITGMDFTPYSGGQMYQDGNQLYGPSIDYTPSPVRSSNEHSVSPLGHFVTPRSQPMTQGQSGAYFNPNVTYAQEQLPTMYAIPYPSQLLQDGQSALGLDPQSGLGLQSMNHMPHQQVYGATGGGGRRQHMPYG
ncbi:hypothetical protein B0A52_03672 [Exophiala mesophila]|uniref:C2H2-type domain-containing protein n=1 Tax=Exophiala mesophila TaxID=212818 RepID=A0A438NA23_EXOME|nr:hypothetical protein B0A52_03672 [Exophiala mesophila]